MLHSDETLKQIKKLLINIRSNKEGETYKRERWVTLEEAIVLYTITCTESIQNYYESGTANGYSSSWVALAIIQNGLVPNVHTWDPHNRDKIWEKFSIFKNFKKLITFHNEVFINAIKQNRAPNKSLYFIDGGHSESDFLQDLDHVNRIHTKGDILIVHDVSGYEYILNHFKEFSKSKRNKIIPTDRGMGIVWL